MGPKIQVDPKVCPKDTKNPFGEVTEEFFDSLAPEEKDIFKATSVAEQVLQEARLADDATKDRTSRKFADKLIPFVSGIEQYGDALDVIAGVNNMILSPLWGGIRVVLHLAREFGEYFGKITSMLEQIGHILSRLKRLPKLYPDNVELNEALVHVYRHIFIFCGKARAAFGEGKRKRGKMHDFLGLRTVMKLAWKPFKEQFEDTQQNIATYVEIIEKEASLAEKEEAHKERKKAELERQTQASRWVKVEESSKSQEKHHAKVEFFLEEQNVRKVNEWLSPADVETNHAAASKLRHSHTGKWFIDGAEFNGWLGGSHKFLWLYAIPGAGKTILSSTIVNHLKQEFKVNGSALAYFYCDYKDTHKQNPTTVLGTLLTMLGAQNKSAFLEIQTFFEKKHKENPAYSASFDELHSRLLLVSKFFPKIFIVIDALDECSDRGCLMETLLTLSNEPSSNVRIMVTSRNELDIHNAFSKVPSVCIRKDDVTADVESYVKAEIQNCIKTKKLKLRDPSLEKEITATLVEKSEGMFQWVKCQIHHLTSMKSDKTIRAALLKLPKTLDDTYVRILQQLEKENEENIENVQKILRWLVKGVRTLTLGELAEALAVDFEDEDCTVMDFDAVWTDPEDVLVLCGSLVTISPDRTKIALAHYSVKEFLVSSRTRETLPNFYMGGTEVEAELAKTCLTYLCFEDFEDGPLTDSAEFEERLGKYQFLKYAAQSWATHTRQHGDGDETLSDLTLKLLRAEGGNFSAWRQIYHYRGDIDRSTARVHQPLYYASLFGLLHAVKALVAKGDNIDKEGGNSLHAAALEGHYEIAEVLLEKCDVHSTHGKHVNALYAAASRGHEKIVQLLLDKGADIDRHEGKHGTALLVAILEGHKSVVQLLLARGANATMVNKRYGPPLSAAAEKGHERIFRDILQQGVNVNAPGGWHGRPLVSAVVSENEKVVQLLLNSGADVNAKGGKHQTALIAAAALGNLRITQMLVENGAEVNDYNDKTGDALHAASFAGHTDIVTFLLDNGAEVNAKGGKHRNALNAACAQGHEAIVRILLNRGADVNAHDEQQGNAWQLAARYGHTEVVRMLAEAGVDLNARGGTHRTTLEAAAASGSLETVQLIVDLGGPPTAEDLSAALMLAAFKDHQDIIKRLVELGADVNEYTTTRSMENWSPLMAAANQAHTGSIQLLIDLGADVNQEGGFHFTALEAFLASPNLHDDLPELLLRAGADVSICGGDHNASPLAAAVSTEFVKGVKLLLEHGADVNMIRTRDGTNYHFMTALQTAVISGNEEIFELLIENGADVNLTICPSPSDDSGPGYANALQAAAAVENENLVRRLVELGAKLELDSSAPRCTYTSALQIASAFGNTDTVRLLIELGSDVNFPGGYYGTALQGAAHDGHNEVVNLLLDAGANINDCQYGRYGTALQAAVFNGHEDTIRLLVDRGADINLFAEHSQWGYPLIAAAGSEECDDETIPLLVELGADVNVKNPVPFRIFTALQAAANILDTNGCNVLLKHGADVNACGGRLGTALTAGFGRAAFIVARILFNHGALPNIQGGYYQNAISAGIQTSCDSLLGSIIRREDSNRNIECGRWGHPLAAAIRFRGGDGFPVETLLDMEEVDVNAQGGRHGTALHEACIRGDKDLVERLLERGADIKLYAGKFWTPLIAAVWGGNLEVVKFLVEKGADINTNARRTGYFGSALICASWAGRVEIVNYLLENGADVNLKGGRYWTALQAACVRGEILSIVSLLIEKGAEVNAKGGRHGTPLIAASQSLSGSIEIVELLLEKGADVNIEGGRYGNALQSAVIYRNEEIADILVQKGAKPQVGRKWWDNASLSMRNDSADLAQKFLGIGEEISEDDEGSKCSKDSESGWVDVE